MEHVEGTVLEHYHFRASVCTVQGTWVLLQNCHLGLDFMDELLDTLTETENIHEASRIWITTEVHPKFSISLLQVAELVRSRVSDGMCEVRSNPHRAASSSPMSLHRE